MVGDDCLVTGPLIPTMETGIQIMNFEKNGSVLIIKRVVTNLDSLIFYACVRLCV